MSFSRLHVRVVLGLVVALAAVGCYEATPADEAEGAPEPPARVRVETREGALAAVVPGGLHVHRHARAVQATASDGSMRVYVGRLEADDLMRVAGRAKDTVMARGWKPVAEQHFERAIHARFQRGGSPTNPEERRGIWWVERPGGVVVCDGIARRGAEALMDELEDLCRAVELDDGEAGGEAPDPGTDAGGRDGAISP